MTKDEKRDILNKLPDFNPKWAKETQKVWLEAMKALIETIKAVEPYYYPVPVYQPRYYRWWDWGTPCYTGSVTVGASANNASHYLAANNEPLPSDFKFEDAGEAFSELESIILDKGVTGDMLTELVAA